MKRNPYVFRNQANMRGFSLIEFMVASILSMIVLMAVGSGYLASLKLNDTATTRLQVQQDLRTAAGMIIRDARMAGSFGCFNMGEFSSLKTGSGVYSHVFVNGTEGDSGTDNWNLVYADGDDIQATGVKYRTFAADAFGDSFVVDTNIKGLVFVYGVGSALISQDGTLEIASSEDSYREINGVSVPLMMSSCDQLSRLEQFTLKNNKLETSIPTSMSTVLNDEKQRSTLSVMRQVVNVYVIGHPQNVTQNGLYRFSFQGFDKNNKAQWSDPELLMNNVNNMQVSFAYNSCKEGEAEIKFNVASGAIKNNPKPDNYNAASEVGTPVMVNILLNGNAQLNDVDKSSQVVAVNGYRIDAYVRGGNVCVNRTL